MDGVVRAASGGPRHLTNELGDIHLGSIRGDLVHRLSYE
jgi:hypothetical protein